MKTRILDARVEFFDRPFRKPLQLSSGLITEVTEARVTVNVSVKGKEAAGWGSIYLSDLWAWPDPSLTHAQRDAILRAFTTSIAKQLPSLCGDEPEHPLELGLRLHHSVGRTDLFPVETAPLPVLARAMCGSPFDAAIHDAAGIALNQSAFDFYGAPLPIPGADSYFKGGSACQAIAQTLQKPLTSLDAWWLVSVKDDLEKDVRPWVEERGYRCFKLKILAKDSAADAARTVEVYRTVKGWGVAHPRLSVDSNEGNPDAASVLDYLQRLRAADEDAYTALEYLEQPTGRDITKHVHDWRQVTKLKPILLDEGLTSLDLFKETMDQGWSGFALKTCKGHSFALVAAAWAKEQGLIQALQDLTNPGLSAIHSALFAAYIPMLNGIELNSPQYTPAANAEWLPRLAGLLEPRGGVHKLPRLPVPGLGSTL